jgi:hypothetical protein
MDVGVDPPPLRDGILANHPELTKSAEPLVVVIKTPTGLPAARWRLVSFWSSGEGPDLRLHSYEISEANAAQLERFFGP